MKRVLKSTPKNVDLTCEKLFTEYSKKGEFDLDDLIEDVVFQ